MYLLITTLTLLNTTSHSRKHPFPCWIYLHEKNLILILKMDTEWHNETFSSHNQQIVTFSGMSSRVVCVSQARRINFKVEVHFTDLFQTFFERHFEVCERYESRMSACIKIAVLWDVTFCHLIDSYQHFQGQTLGAGGSSLAPNRQNLTDGVTS